LPVLRSLSAKVRALDLRYLVFSYLYFFGANQINQDGMGLAELCKLFILIFIRSVIVTRLKLAKELLVPLGEEFYFLC
jgi:hypothetical protein